MLCHSTPTLCSTIHTGHMHMPEYTHTHTHVGLLMSGKIFQSSFLPWLLSFVNSQAFCVGIRSPHSVSLSCLRSVMKLGRLYGSDLMHGIRPCLLIGGLRGPEKLLITSEKPCLSNCKVVQAEHLAVALRTYYWALTQFHPYHHAPCLKSMG